ncbi:alpha/beta hydrolase [Saccharothrix coeruleofusca]|uniref:Peptidase n=1 Tax=Saccharothrix coeruleofusca TaxID=33919 RepID=A0A918ALS5_9PSEU|nr:alpha/beta hydrolase [Saccharothrix coeruleofusca]GGP46505.1 peptidase [Saccharothrix coeruleofusca]
MRTTAAMAVTAALLLSGAPAFAQDAQRLHGQFLDQRITWSPCAEPELEGLECGTFATPFDWRRPGDERAITIAVSRSLPAGGQAARGSVLTNPGGPGGAGRILPRLFQTRPRVADNFEVVGVDVRGTGASDNVTCGGYSWFGLADPRDRSRANLDLHYDAAELQATACQVRSGELGRVVDTEQTVRDLDLLRHLLGREEVSWIGYSGGTWLGAHYATHFPQRVDKFVLDSVADFTGTFQDVFDDFGMATERRLRVDFLPWVARHDAVYHLGDTADAVWRSYERTRAALAAEPIALPDGSWLNGAILDLVVRRGLYSKLTFPDIAESLAALASGAAAAAALADIGTAARFADAESATLYTVTCNDTPFRGDRSDLARQGDRQGKRYPFFGHHQVLAPCASWDRPPLRLKTPDGEGVPPVLMVQSVRDPATSLEGARRAHRGFAGSRLITVEDEGDHGIYAVGNACVDDLVESFLVDGVVPAADLTCPGTPLPEPTAARSAPLPLGWPL